MGSREESEGIDQGDERGSPVTNVEGDNDRDPRHSGEQPKDIRKGVEIFIRKKL